jgi:acetyltransferase-like isoleucine patch superfamily enzyme
MNTIMKVYRFIKSNFYTVIIRLYLNKFSGKIKVSTFKVFSINGPTKIGDGFFAGESFYVSTNKYCKLIIGKKVIMGPDVMILGGNHNHSYTNGHICDYSLDQAGTKDIYISDGAWIGARTIILSGSEISEGVVVGAQSLVSHKIPPYVIATGSPAKRYRARFSKCELLEVLRNTESSLNLSDIEEAYLACDIDFKIDKGTV